MIRASIERSGKRWRLRVGPRAARRTLDTFDTEEAAERALAGLLAAGAKHASGATLLSVGATWLKAREGQIRSIENERSIWRTHVMPAPFARKPIEAVKRREIVRYLEGKLANGDTMATVGKALRQIRQVMREAVAMELIKVNPVPSGEIKLREPVSQETEAADDEDAIVFLTREQQLAVLACEAIPERLRAVYAVAIYTGARLSELKAVQWQDLDLDGEAPTWTLRRGRKGTTKNRKVRRFQLMALAPTAGVPEHFANAIAAFKWWRENTPHGTAPGDLVFPNTKGNRYHEKRDFDWSDKRYTDRKGNPRVRLGGKSKALGEDFACTFHQLRHTAASALISGMWGRAWSKPEIQAWMGWKSRAMVERYAHLAGSQLAEAVKSTAGLPQICPNDDEAPGIESGEKAGDSEGFGWWAIADLNCGLPPCEEGTLPLS